MGLEGEVLLGSAQALAPLRQYGTAQALETTPQGGGGFTSVLVHTPPSPSWIK